ncbi:MAG: GntR family transcriptional regulator [Pseudomonadota bacterium]
MTDTTSRNTDQTRPGFRPLYAQVRELLVARIARGEWAPGEALPSEGQIAVDLDVSQGTVRKALDAMTADRLLVRRQGRGTFVASHDENRVLFQFFKLTPDGGAREFPTSRLLRVDTGKATAEERTILELQPNARVIRIERVRDLAGGPALIETISLPAALFPGFEKGEVPNNLYGLFATGYGVSIAVASETLKAVSADPKVATDLGVPNGSPLLMIERVARSIDGTAVEWRRSLCRTDRFHYVSELR